jgi:hypothetical protein
MPFCYAPWTNLDISPQGDIMPCCKYVPDVNDKPFNLQTHSLSEYSGSAFLQQIKQEFVKDQWPTGCVRCQIDEQNNIKSKRQLDHDRWQEHFAQYQLHSEQWITASIAFGNTCNLKCITCNSYSSSRWHDEYLTVYNQDIQHVKFYRHDFIETFLSQAPGIIHLDIPGGEPFLSGIKEQKKLLGHYVQTEQAANISLHYTTNTTIFPDDEWWELWSYFREVDIQLSIDGIGARYEYIRYPAVWNVTESNVRRYIQQEKEIHNLRLSVSHTVSAYNIFYLDEFFNWCQNTGLPNPWLGRVYYPDHMKPEVWADSARNLIQQQLLISKHDDVRTWAGLMVNGGNQFDEFCKRLHQHDQYRNLNFVNTFPELAQYIK